MSDRVRVDLEAYAATPNPAPPAITPDPIPSGGSTTDRLLGMLGTAVNSGDADDNAAAQAGHRERQAGIAYALERFPAQEQQSVTQLAQIGSAGGVQMVDAPAPPPTGHVTVCEPYQSGGGFVCWDWYLDGSIARGWSPTDRSGGYP
jgi:hypothetical protein